jgi:hypothetical protein
MSKKTMGLAVASAIVAVLRRCGTRGVEWVSFGHKDYRRAVKAGLRLGSQDKRTVARLGRGE